jgi:hypothetical protein
MGSFDARSLALRVGFMIEPATGRVTYVQILYVDGTMQQDDALYCTACINLNPSQQDGAG